MAKSKTFAEKMLKNLKPPDMFTNYKVIKTAISSKGTVRFDTRVVRVHKEENESEKLGIS